MFGGREGEHLQRVNDLYLVDFRTMVCHKRSMPLCRVCVFHHHTFKYRIVGNFHMVQTFVVFADGPTYSESKNR